MGLIREYTNAILDFQRIVACVQECVRAGDPLEPDLLGSLASVLVRRQQIETQYEILRLVTDPIPLIPFNKEV